MLGVSIVRFPCLFAVVTHMCNKQAIVGSCCTSAQICIVKFSRKISCVIFKFHMRYLSFELRMQYLKPSANRVHSLFDWSSPLQ